MKQSLAVLLAVSFILVGCDKPEKSPNASSSETAPAGAIVASPVALESASSTPNKSVEAKTADAVDSPVVIDDQQVAAEKPHKVRRPAPRVGVKLPPLRLDMRLPDGLLTESATGSNDLPHTLLPRLVDAGEPPSLVHLSGRLLQPKPNERQDALVDGAEIQLEFRH